MEYSRVNHLIRGMRMSGDRRNADMVRSMHDTLTFILTCDHDQLMIEGMDRVRAVLKLADGN